ncbi:MAG TPA: hypothetical protein VM366_17280 [Anaerolineae bacterium]|nr:hypothetical protein [Anaerolineae bacterium]
MATPQGVGHVEAALELVGRAADTISKLEGLEEMWRTEAVGRLSSITDLLSGTMDRFYLKTKVCLPFARRCEEEARRLDSLVAELSAQGTSDLQPRLAAAMEALVKAARTLDERSLMQGMAIT